MLSSRRDFFKTGASAVAYASTLQGLEYALSAEQIPANRLTLIDALRDKDAKLGIRERYLNQLVREMLGDKAFEHVSELKYDHNGSLKYDNFYKWMKEYSKDARHHAYLRKELDMDHELLTKALDTFSARDPFSDMPRMQRTSKIIEYLNTGEGIFEYAIIRMRDLARPVIMNASYASTFNNPYVLGTGKKSIVFVERDIFEEIRTEIMGKPFSFPLTESFIKDCLYHEFMHARDFSLGIDAGDGLWLDNTNAAGIDDAVEGFVVEGNAYKSSMEITRISRENLGRKYNASHIISSVNLDSLFRETYKKLEGKKISGESKALLGAMSRKLRPNLEEANEVLMNTFYEKL